MKRVLLALCAAAAFGQAPDTILVNGKILTADEEFSIQQALAIRDGKIAALGTSADMRKLAGASTRTIDLGGRTVIPGLIDSHMHAIRAALSFSTEVNWIGSPSVADAMARIREGARSKPPGSWLIVAGGWNADQFKERRRPTQAELIEAAPNNPVYVQLGYAWAMLTPAAYKALSITDESSLPSGGRFERDAQGKPTGAITGAIVPLFDRLPKPTYEQQVDGTKKFFRELNRLGLTGVMDPGGNNLGPPDYAALLEVWRSHQMTVRVAYTLGSQTAGKEFEEYQEYTRFLPTAFGDDYLRFLGLGEHVTEGMYNNSKPTETDRERFYQIARWAAGRGMSVTVHWSDDASVSNLLDVFERVNHEVPIAGLRWSVAHLNDASDRTLERMKTLGVGWTVQDAMYFSGDGFQRLRGSAAALRVPPVNTAKRLGVAVGAGTDAHRVASYNPFTALQWFLDGKTVTGNAIRGPQETPSREDALRFYSIGSAWFSRDDQTRGSLQPGKLADLAVLSKDYMTAPVSEIGGIESLLTMVGGKVVYAAEPFHVE